MTNTSKLNKTTAMELILHIGQSKTGTTALQSVFSRNRDLLTEKYGILYPDLILNGTPIEFINHNPFSNALNDFSYYPHLTKEEYWQQFKEQFNPDKHQKMLLSGESFFGGRPYIWELNSPEEYMAAQREKITNLRKLTEGCDITVIVYLRPQYQWLESAIPHIIRYEGTMKEKVYTSDPEIINLLKPCIDYNSLLSEWETILQPKKIIAREYNRETLKDKNIITDFLSILEIEDKDLSTMTKDDNPHDSWSREFIELKKKLNYKKRHRVIEDAILEKINRLNTRFGKKQKYYLSSELYDDIFSSFEACNDQLGKKYNNGNAIFSIKRADLNNKSDIKVSEEDAERLYNDLSNSLEGYKIVLLSLAKRVIRKTNPALYSKLSIWWRSRKKAAA